MRPAEFSAAAAAFTYAWRCASSINVMIGLDTVNPEMVVYRRRGQ